MMSAGGRLQLLGVKQFLIRKINSLRQMGCLETTETLRCRHCFERYTLLIDAGKTDPDRINVLELAEPVKMLVELVSKEHATGHASDSFTLECGAPAAQMNHASQQNPFFNVRPGERITASWPAGLLGDCSLCSQCDRPSFRLVQLICSAGKHRYVPFCEDHFMDTCLVTPELIDLEFDNALKQVRLKLKA